MISGKHCGNPEALRPIEPIGFALQMNIKCVICAHVEQHVIGIDVPMRDCLLAAGYAVANNGATVCANCIRNGPFRRDEV